MKLFLAIIALAVSSVCLAQSDNNEIFKCPGTQSLTCDNKGLKAIEVDKAYPELIGNYEAYEGKELVSVMISENVLSFVLTSWTAYAVIKNGDEYQIKGVIAGKKVKTIEQNEGCRGMFTEFEGYCMRTVTIKKIDDNRFDFSELNKTMTLNKTNKPNDEKFSIY